MAASPSFITMTRSASSASAMWWVMSTTVMPRSRFSRWMVSSTSRRPWGSSIAVASSSTMHSGSMAMTPAMATRCFCPPESRCGAWRAKSLMPTAAKASSTLRRISCGGTPRFSGAKATSSSTTLATIWLSGFWNTMPTRRRISSSIAWLWVSIPSTYTAPPDGRSTAFICLAKVDFPEPLCPSTTTKLPFSMPRLTPRSAGSLRLPSSAG